MLEKELERKFCNAVKKAGGQSYKFVSPGANGVPDRLIVFPEGRIGFVELKQKGKKPTPLQKLRIQRLKALGCYVMVLDDIKDADRVIQDLYGDPKQKMRGDT